MTSVVLDVIAGLACALLLGGMVGFAGLFARVAFAQLPRDEAAALMRAAFPSYYMLMGLFAAVAAAALVWRLPWDALALALVAGGFVLARYWLMPLGHRLHEAREQGRPGAADRFDRVHRQSASLNFFQMIAALVVLARLLAGA